MHRILFGSLIWNQEYKNTFTPPDDITSLANKLLTANSYVSTASEQSQDIMHFSPYGQAAHKVFFHHQLLFNTVFLLLNIDIFVIKN